jgi:hypothetical protein
MGLGKDGSISLEACARSGAYDTKDIHGCAGPPSSASDGAQVLRPGWDIKALVDRLRSEGYEVALVVLF